jgi:hypothetical protein
MDLFSKQSPVDAATKTAGTISLAYKTVHAVQAQNA